MTKEQALEKLREMIRKYWCNIDQQDRDQIYLAVQTLDRTIKELEKKQ